MIEKSKRNTKDAILIAPSNRQTSDIQLIYEYLTQNLTLFKALDQEFFKHLNYAIRGYVFPSQKNVNENEVKKSIEAFIDDKEDETWYDNDKVDYPELQPDLTKMRILYSGLMVYGDGEI